MSILRGNSIKFHGKDNLFGHWEQVFFVYIRRQDETVAKWNDMNRKAAGSAPDCGPKHIRCFANGEGEA